MRCTALALVFLLAGCSTPTEPDGDVLAPTQSPVESTGPETWFVVSDNATGYFALDLWHGNGGGGMPVQADPPMTIEFGPFGAVTGSRGLDAGSLANVTVFLSSPQPGLLDLTIDLFADGKPVAWMRGYQVAIPSLPGAAPPEEVQATLRLFAPIPAESVVALKVTVKGSSTVFLMHGEEWPSRVELGVRS